MEEESPSAENNFTVESPVAEQSSMKSSDTNADIHDLDVDDEVNAQMTASYSEISFNSDKSGEYHGIIDHICPPRPANLTGGDTQPNPSLNLGDFIQRDGDMTHFVADDIEFKIKLSSPIARKAEGAGFSSAGHSRSSTPSGLNLYRQLLAPNVGHIDTTILNDLEHEAQKIAHSVDNLIENLSSLLHSISSITADNVEVYKDSVSKTCDAMDSNIKSMYTILAKGEEVSIAMIPVQAQAARVVEIKRLLNILENNI